MCRRLAAIASRPRTGWKWTVERARPPRRCRWRRGSWRTWPFRPVARCDTVGWISVREPDREEADRIEMPSRTCPAWTTATRARPAEPRRGEAVPPPCTLGELEALAHRLQIARHVDAGLPYPHIAGTGARARPRHGRPTGCGTAAAGARRWRSSAPRDAGRATGPRRGRFQRAGERPAHRRRPLEGADAAADARPLRRRRTRASRPPSAGAAVPAPTPPSTCCWTRRRHSAVRPARVVDAADHRCDLVVESEADVSTVAELGFARCTLEAAVPVDAPHATLADLERLRRRPPIRPRPVAASTGSVSRSSWSRSTR